MNVALSLVIPCYNEEKNLSELIRYCIPILDRKDIQIIFEDNGSTDNTPDILPGLINGYLMAKYLRVEINKGYGNGIMCGLKAADSDILAWTHADLQTNPLDILIGLDMLDMDKISEAVFIKGKRVKRSLFDWIFTSTMRIIGWIIVGVNLEDVNGQPTIFSRKFFKNWDNPPEDSLLDLYAFLKAKNSGINISRFPVNYLKRKYGIGYNESLLSKLRFSILNIKYMLEYKILNRN